MLFKDQLYFTKPPKCLKTSSWCLGYSLHFLGGIIHERYSKQCCFWSSQDTFLKIIKILLIGRGEAITVEESSLRKWEGLVFSSEKEEFGKKNKGCVSDYFPREQTSEKLYLHVLYCICMWSQERVKESEAVRSCTRCVTELLDPMDLLRSHMTSSQDCQFGMRKEEAFIQQLTSQRTFQEALALQHFWVVLMRIPRGACRVPSHSENR